MRHAVFLTVAGLLCCAAWQSPAANEPPRRPFDVNRRVPWNDSRVVGSPNPPPPYRVRRVFPKLQLPCPIGVAHEPGTDNLLLIHQAVPWGGIGRIVRIKDDQKVEKA